MVSLTQLGPGIELMVLNVHVGRRHRQRVASLVEAGKCLAAGCPEPPDRRGLCCCHYSRYRNARFQLPLDERPLFDARLIRRGELLPSRQGQRLQHGVKSDG